MRSYPHISDKVPAPVKIAGIIIDATVIRGVLAPALVALLGHLNWWLPAPAARLLRVTPLRPKDFRGRPPA